MSNKEKILQIVNYNGGYITSEDLKKNNIKSMFLTRLVKENILRKISKGYYGTKDYVEDIYFSALSKSKNAVFSYNTALYLHNLSERTPLVFEITVPYDYNGSLLNEKNVNLNYVSRDIINIGVEEIISPFGMYIKVYDMERTICDIIKNRHKMDAEIFSKALKYYVNSSKKDLNKLMNYAKKMKIERKVLEYMTILL